MSEERANKALSSAFSRFEPGAGTGLKTPTVNPAAGTGLEKLTVSTAAGTAAGTGRGTGNVTRFGLPFNPPTVTGISFSQYAEDARQVKSKAEERASSLDQNELGENIGELQGKGDPTVFRRHQSMTPSVSATSVVSLNKYGRPASASSVRSFNESDRASQLPFLEIPRSSPISPTSQTSARSERSLKRNLDNPFHSPRGKSSRGASNTASPSFRPRNYNEDFAIIARNSWLKNYYLLLWHSDVHKDHGTDYDTRILNGILPYAGVYQTMLKKRNTNTWLNPEPIYKTASFQTVFSALVFPFMNGIHVYDKEIYNKIQGLKAEEKLRVAVGYNDTTERPLFFYDCCSFNNIDDERVMVDTVKKMKFFCGTLKKILKYTDTQAHADAMLHYWNIDDSNNPTLLQVHDRAAQNDPLLRMNPTSAKPKYRESVKKAFYYESPGGNARDILFPRYTDTIESIEPLSKFFCDRDVLLRLKGLEDEKKGSLNVDLVIVDIITGKEIVVPDDGNKANAWFRVRNFLFTLFRMRRTPFTDTITKQVVYISKHHGDIGQVLATKRNMTLKSFLHGRELLITQRDTKQCFETYDANAASKALSIGVDYLWFHTNDKKRIVVFKKNTGDNERNLKIIKENRSDDFFAKIANALEMIERAETKRETIVNLYDALFSLEIFMKMLGEVVDGQDTYTKKYKAVLHFSLSYAYHKNRMPHREPSFTPSIEKFKSLTEDINDKELDTLSTELDVIIQKALIYDKFNMTNPFDAANKLILVSSSKEIINIVYPDGSKSSTVGVPWSTVDLESSRSILEEGQIFQRLFSRIDSRWAFDQVVLIYNGLAYRDGKAFGEKFLDAISGFLSSQLQPTFIKLCVMKGLKKQRISGGNRNKTRNKRMRGGVKKDDDETEILLGIFIEDTQRFLRFVGPIVRGGDTAFQAPFWTPPPEHAVTDLGGDFGEEDTANFYYMQNYVYVLGVMLKSVMKVFHTREALKEINTIYDRIFEGSRDEMENLQNQLGEFAVTNGQRSPILVPSRLPPRLPPRLPFVLPPTLPPRLPPRLPVVIPPILPPRLPPAPPLRLPPTLPVVIPPILPPNGNVKSSQSMLRRVAETIRRSITRKNTPTLSIRDSGKSKSPRSRLQRVTDEIRRSITRKKTPTPTGSASRKVKPKSIFRSFADKFSSTTKKNNKPSTPPKINR